MASNSTHRSLLVFVVLALLFSSAAAFGACENATAQITGITVTPVPFESKVNIAVGYAFSGNVDGQTRNVFLSRGNYFEQMSVGQNTGTAYFTQSVSCFASADHQY